MSGNGNGNGAPGAKLEWHRVLDVEDLPEGRVTTVAAGHKSVAWSTTTASSRRSTTDQAAQLRERRAIWRAEKENRAADDRGNGVNSASIFAALGRQIDPDAVIAVDVGNNTYSFGR